MSTCSLSREVSGGDQHGSDDPANQEANVSDIIRICFPVSIFCMHATVGKTIVKLQHVLRNLPFFIFCIIVLKCEKSEASYLYETSEIKR